MEKSQSIINKVKISVGVNVDLARPKGKPCKLFSTPWKSILVLMFFNAVVIKETLHGELTKIEN